MLKFLRSLFAYEPRGADNPARDISAETDDEYPEVGPLDDDLPPEYHAAQETFLDAVRARAAEDAAVLVRKQRQLVYKDDYGTHIFDDWYREVGRYIKSRLSTDVAIYEMELAALDIDVDFDLLVLLVEDVISEVINTADTSNADEGMTFDVSDPIRFERSVADCFSQFGWEARLTQLSGDQGVDVIAEKGSRRVVVQCKLHAKPIGNGAVQEVIAAREFDGATEAMVVASSEFTRSAQQLANSAGVLLTHYEDLPRYLESLDRSITSNARDERNQHPDTRENSADSETDELRIERLITEAEQKLRDFERVAKGLDESKFNEIATHLTNLVNSLKVLLYSSAVGTFVKTIGAHLRETEPENYQKLAPV
jgi:restriction system protein